MTSHPPSTVAAPKCASASEVDARLRAALAPFLEASEELVLAQRGRHWNTLPGGADTNAVMIVGGVFLSTVIAMLANSGSFSAAGTCFALFVVAVAFAVPLAAALLARGMVHAVTSRRVLSLRAGKLRALNIADVRTMTRKEQRDGTGELRFELAKPHEGAWEVWRGVEEVLLFARAIEASPSANFSADHVPTTPAAPRSVPSFRRELEQGGGFGCLRVVAVSVLVFVPLFLLVASVRSGAWVAGLFVFMGSGLCFGFAGRIWAWHKHTVTHFLQVTPEGVSFRVFRMNISDRLVKEEYAVSFSELSSIVLDDPLSSGPRTCLLVRGAEVVLPPFLLWDRASIVKFAQAVRRHHPDVAITGDAYMVRLVLAQAEQARTA